MNRRNKIASQIRLAGPYDYPPDSENWVQGQDSEWSWKDPSSGRLLTIPELEQAAEGEVIQEALPVWEEEIETENPEVVSERDFYDFLVHTWQGPGGKPGIYHALSAWSTENTSNEAERVARNIWQTISSTYGKEDPKPASPWVPPNDFMEFLNQNPREKGLQWFKVIDPRGMWYDNGAQDGDFIGNTGSFIGFKKNGLFGTVIDYIGPGNYDVGGSNYEMEQNTPTFGDYKERGIQLEPSSEEAIQQAVKQINISY